MTLWSSHYSNRSPTTSLSAYREAVSSARLAEAEIVSPYYGILINMGIGSPTAPLIAASGERAGSTRQVWRRKSFYRLYKEIRPLPSTTKNTLP